MIHLFPRIIEEGPLYQEKGSALIRLLKPLSSLGIADVNGTLEVCTLSLKLPANFILCFILRPKQWPWVQCGCIFAPWPGIFSMVWYQEINICIKRHWDESYVSPENSDDMWGEMSHQTSSCRQWECYWDETCTVHCTIFKGFELCFDRTMLHLAPMHLDQGDSVKD